MRQHLFLHYGWFLQNLKKGCIRTNMHTTVQFVLKSNILYIKMFFIEIASHLEKLHPYFLEAVHELCRLIIGSF